MTTPIGLHVRALRVSLGPVGISPVDDEGRPEMSRTYYSLRTDRTKRIELPTLCDALQCTYAAFAEKQYFDEAFGKSCPGGDILGIAGSDIEGFFLTRLLTRGLWPITQNYRNYAWNSCTT
jgi:hypothetical protein